MATPTLKDILRVYSVPEKWIDQPCEDEHLMEIALKIPEWETVATFLGLKEQDQKVIRKDHMDSYKEQKIQMLKEWKSLKTREATYRKLMQVFLKLGKTDLAEKLCEMIRDSPPSPLSPTREIPQQTPPTNSSETHVGSTDEDTPHEIPLEKVDGTTLDISSLQDLREELISVTRWKDLGLKFRIGLHTLEDIEARQDRLSDRVTEVLTAWLKWDGAVAQKGLPSWRTLVAALRCPTVGYPEVANQIALNHRVP